MSIKSVKKIFQRSQSQLLIFIIILFVVTLPNYVSAIGFHEWEKTSVESGFRPAEAKSVAIYNDSIYVAGYDASGGRTRIRIELRSLATGELITDRGWGNKGVLIDGGSGNFSANAVTVDSSGVYYAGFGSPFIFGNNFYGYVAKRDHVGTLLWGDYYSFPLRGEFFGIVSYNNALYAAGYERNSGSSYWLVKKLSLVNGSTLFSYKSANRGPGAAAYDVAVDSSGVYVAGVGALISQADTEWYIEKLKIDSGQPFGLDGDGLVGDNPSGGDDRILAITLDSNSIYMTGYEQGNVNLLRLRIEKRDKLSGNLIDSFGTNGVVSEYHRKPSGGTAQAGRSIAIDGNSIFIAGNVYGADAGGEGWLVQKRDATKGTLLWEQIGDRENGDEIANDIAINRTTPTSTIYVVGYETLTDKTKRWRMEKTKQELRAGEFIRPAYIFDLRNEINRLREMAKLPLPFLWSTDVLTGRPIRADHINEIRNAYPVHASCPTPWVSGNIESDKTVVSKEHFNEISRAIEKNSLIWIGDQWVLGGREVKQCDNWYTLAPKPGWAITSWSRVTCDGKLEHRAIGWFDPGDGISHQICDTDWKNVISGDSFGVECVGPYNYGIPSSGRTTRARFVAVRMRWNYNGGVCTGVANGTNKLCVNGSYIEGYYDVHTGKFVEDSGGWHDAWPPCAANNFNNF